MNMNHTSPKKKLTHYYDKNGKQVRVGDCIKFLFWQTRSDGLQHEAYYFGRIVKKFGKLAFRYKPDGEHWSERRLDCLHFDSTSDWEIYYSPSWKLIK